VVALPLVAALISLVCSARLQIALALVFQVGTFGVALALIARILVVGGSMPSRTGSTSTAFRPSSCS